MSGSDFWSRRRAAVRAEEAAEAQAAETRTRAAEDAAREAAQAEKTDEEILEELGLPDPDTIADGEAARAFMAREVPERLRRRALRRLWRTNPVLANLDGLVDYDEDYGSLGVSPGGVKTVYEVGKGMFAALDADRPETEQRTDSEAAATPEMEQDPANGESTENAPDAVDAIDKSEESSGPEEFFSSRAKRMRYSFES